MFTDLTGTVFGLGGMVFGLLIFAFWVWMLCSAIVNKELGDGAKIAWVIAILFLSVLGALLYYFLGRSKRRVLRAIPVVQPWDKGERLR